MIMLPKSLEICSDYERLRKLLHSVCPKVCFTDDLLLILLLPTVRGRMSGFINSESCVYNAACLVAMAATLLTFLSSLSYLPVLPASFWEGGKSVHI